MSKTVDERVVKMRFDNFEFEQKTKNTMSTLDKLKTALKFDKGEEGFKKIDNASKKLNFNSMANSLENVANKFSALDIIGVGALLNLGNAAMDWARKTVKSLTIEPVSDGWEEYGLKMGSVQTIMASTGASLDEVNGYLSELNTYSDKTIYSFSDMTNSIGKFTNAGVGLKDAVAAIQGISNEAAVSGANAQEASRAMYNFAQALSAGYVKLIDWKSIENANMATVEFKNELLQTAEKLGTVEKQADGMYKVLGTNAQGSTMKETINATKNFNDSLAYQWMTTDVLTKTLAKYADETTDIGKKAFAAAQDIKTFSMLMDTLKEAVGSGWAETFELIIGDFEEAKQLWTSIGNTLGGIIDNVSNARNNMIKNVIDRGTWGDLKTQLKDAGISAKEFKEELLAVNNISWEKVKKQYGSMDKAFAKGGLFKAKDINKALDKMVDKRKKVVYSSMSDAAVKATGYTEAQISGLRNLQNQAKRSGTALNFIYETIDRPKSGRELLIEAFSHAFGELGEMLDAVGKAWTDVFGKFDGEPVYDAIQAFNEFVMKLDFSDDSADKLRRTFKGLFAILDIVTTLIGGAFTRVIKLIGKLLLGVDVDVLSVTASLGDMVVKFRDWLLVSGPIAKAFEAITEALAPAASTVKGWAEEIYNSEDTQQILTKISDAVTVFGTVIGKYFKMAADAGKDLSETYNGFKSIKDVKQFLTDIGDSIRNLDFNNVGDGVEIIKSKILTPFKKAQEDTTPSIDKVGDSFTGLKTKLATFTDYITGTFSKINLGSIVTIAFGAATFKTFNRLLDVIFGFAKPFEAMAGFISSLKTVIVSFNKFLDAKAFATKTKGIYNIAKSIAVLAGSLFLVSKIPADRLLASAVALGALIIVLAKSTSYLMKASKDMDPTSVISMGISLIAIAGSVFVLVKALEVMVSLASDGKKLWMGVGALLTILLSVIGTIWLMTKINTEKMAISATSIIGITLAVYVLVKAVSQLAEVVSSENFKPGALVASIVGIVVALGALTAVAGTFGPASAAGGFGVLAIAAGIYLMVTAIKRIAKIKDEELSRGLIVITALSVIYGKLMILSMFTGGNADKVGAGLLAMASSLIVIAIGIKMISSLSEQEIEKGLTVIVKCFALFTAVMALSKLSGQYSARAGLMILEMSGAMIMIATSIMMLSMIDETALKSATNAVSQILVIFGLLIGISKFAGSDKGVKLTIAALTTSIAVLCVSLGVLSMIPAKDLQNATNALETIMIALTAIVGMSKLASKSASGMLAITALLVVTAGALYILAKMGDTDSLLDTAKSISAVLIALSVSLAITSVVGNNALNSLKSLTMMSLVLLELAAVFKIMDEFNIKPSMDTALALSTLMLALSVALIAVSAAGTFGLVAAAEGTAGLMIFVAGLAVLLAALSNLNELMDGAITDGIPLLIDIASGFGAAIGAFIAAFVDTALSCIPEIGQYLSDFATNAQPFFDQLKTVDGSMVASAAAIAGILLALGATEVVSAIGGILSAFTGVEVDIRGQLVSLGQGLSAFAEVTADVKSYKVKSAAEAAKALVETCADIPNTGGVLGWLVGNNDADQFGMSLVGLGMGINLFSNSLLGTKWKLIEKATEGGVAQLIQMCSDIPNAGGKINKFIGDNKADDYGDQLVGFGNGINQFSNSLLGTKWSLIDKSTEGGVKKLIKMCGDIPNAGGIVAKFLGDNEVDKFGTSLSGLGSGVQSYSNNLSGTKWSDIDDANQYLPKLFKMVEEVESFYMGQNDFAILGQNLNDFGDQIKQYSEKLADVDKDAINVGTDVMKGLSSGMSKESGGVGTAMSKALSSSLKKVKRSKRDFELAGKALMTQMSVGVKRSTETLEKAIKSIGNAMISTTRDYYRHFVSAGEYIDEGFAEGLDKKKRLVTTAVKNLANSSEKIARLELQIKSPSRKFMKIGGYCGEGFVKGLNSYTESVADASSTMAKTAVSSLSDAMSGVKGNIADIDYDPTITPVLDLSNIKAGANSISSLLNDQTLGLNSNFNAVTRLDSSRYQPDNSDVITAINGLSHKLNNVANTTYNVNGITYDDGSNITSAVSSLVHAVKMERRI